jgi:2-oxoglutarate dehydrogenase E2 component (dihydrolipoamide succinyltransferase)
MPALIDIRPPADVQNASEIVVERWLHQPGARVRANEPLLELNTDKAVVEVPSPADGVLQEVLRKASDAVQPTDVLGRIATDGEAAKPAATGVRAKSAQAPAAAPAAGPGRTDQLSPAIRQLVRQHNLDISKVQGTGRGGRITVEDVQNYLKGKGTSAPAAAATAPAAPTTPGGSRKVPHSPMRRRIAQHMVESALRTAPHVTAVFEADFSAVVAHRKQHEAAFAKAGVKLTYTAYLVAATVKALQAVPEVNARWHDDALEIFDDCNIGIATAIPGGLIVPVLPRAQTLDLRGIATRLQDLTAKARAGKLDLGDLQGGTFTITNHGVSGSLIATPIINQPQVAILGVGKLEKRIVVVEHDGTDATVIKPMAYVTLTIDHRALDGFQANAFLTKFVAALGNW